MLNGTVTSKELYAYDKSNFQGEDSNGWPLNDLLAYYLGKALNEMNDGKGVLTYTHTEWSKRYFNILEQLMAMDKISIPDDLVEILQPELNTSQAITSARLCKEIANKVKNHLDQIKISISNASWNTVARYMNHHSLNPAYVMHLTPEQNQKLITELLKAYPSNPKQSEYINKICAELPQPAHPGPQPPLDSDVTHNENKTFFNAVTQKYLGLATLCIIIGIVTCKYYHASPETEDEKEQEQISAA